MATLTADVATGADDWDTSSTTATLIKAERVRDFGGILTTNYSAYANLDTSGIDPTWTIDSAVLHWYTNSYSKTPKGDPDGSAIYMKNNSSVWTIIESTSSARSTGWEQYTLSATERGYIKDDTDTEFRFVVTNSDSILSIRSWYLRSYEHTASNGYSVYLEIDYTIPSAGRRNASRFIIIG